MEWDDRTKNQLLLAESNNSVWFLFRDAADERLVSSLQARHERRIEAAEVVAKKQARLEAKAAKKISHPSEADQADACDGGVHRVAGSCSDMEDGGPRQATKATGTKLPAKSVASSSTGNMELKNAGPMKKDDSRTWIPAVITGIASKARYNGLQVLINTSLGDDKFCVQVSLSLYLLPLPLSFL